VQFNYAFQRTLDSLMVTRMEGRLHFAPLVVACVVLASPAASSPARVACELTSLQAEYQVGGAPQLMVQIINRGPEAIYLPGSLDGSERLKRYPHVLFTVVGPNGRIPPEPYVGCGNTNSLRPLDFVRVDTGNSFDPYMRIDDGGFWHSTFLQSFRFSSLGEYEFTFHYSTQSESLQTWEGTPVCVNCPTPPEVVAKVNQVPAVDIECSTRVRVVGSK